MLDTALDNPPIAVKGSMAMHLPNSADTRLSRFLGSGRIIGNSECMVRRLVAKAKSELTGWSAQMYAAFVGAVAPGQDGMRCVLSPLVGQS